jgi:hypothetical protein
MQLATPTFVPAAYAMNASKSFLRHISFDNSSINNNLCGCTTSASTSFSQSAEVLSDNNTYTEDVKLPLLSHTPAYRNSQTCPHTPEDLLETVVKVCNLPRTDFFYYIFFLVSYYLLIGLPVFSIGPFGLWKLQFIRKAKSLGNFPQFTHQVFI